MLNNFIRNYVLGKGSKGTWKSESLTNSKLNLGLKMCIFTLQEKNKLQIAFILETLELALFYLTILSEVT